MATAIQVVIDCADPATLSEFWATALHYKLEDPPPGFDTWQDFLREQGIPEEKWNSASAVADPEGKGPRLYFQQVPEKKEVKNRLHLDLNVGGGRGATLEDRRKSVDTEVDRLVAAGATIYRPGEVSEFGEYWVTLRDPEGNEFCIQ
ncbi:MAG: VOC family protein [Acidimicrobiales bacterium]